jgi:small subunit ribosomal protein S4
MGLAGDTTSIDDTLDLDIRDLLERRLQTVVLRGGLAGSASQSRQLISHGHITVSGRVVTVPGYLVAKADDEGVRYAAESPIAKNDHPARQSLKGQPTEPASPVHSS